MTKPSVATDFGIATKNATMDSKLEDPNVAKSELEHYAARKIKHLKSEIEKIKASIQCMEACFGQGFTLLDYIESQKALILILQNLNVKGIKGQTMKDKEFLEWIRDRLVRYYGEERNVDYMLKLQSIINATDEDKSTPNIAVAPNKTQQG